MNTGTARSAVSAAAPFWLDADLVERVVIKLSFRHPPPEGTVQGLCRGRSPGFTGRRIPSGLPEAFAPVASREVLTAYSCGGSRGIGIVPHRIPFLRPASCGNQRCFDYSRRGSRRKEETRTLRSAAKRARALTNGAGSFLCASLTVARFEQTGNAVRIVSKSAAAPATVCGEPEDSSSGARAIATGPDPGRRQGSRPAKPGDLPSIWSSAGRGASGTVGFMAEPMRSGRCAPL